MPSLKGLDQCVCVCVCVCIYSGYGKYSDPIKLFTLCYIAAISLIIVHTALHIDRRTQNC